MIRPGGMREAIQSARPLGPGVLKPWLHTLSLQEGFTLPFFPSQTGFAHCAGHAWSSTSSAPKRPIRDDFEK